MNRSEVSIIVPVYNVEKFLSRCIDSILEQTYRSFELILIDDGSKDHSLDIIREYQKKYPDQIRALTQKNHGVAYTRNRGLEIAIGKYVTFIDSDDYVDLDFLEVLVNEIGQNDAIFSGYKRVDDYGKICGKFQLYSDDWARFKYTATCGKLYRADFLKKNKIVYPDYKIGEDLFFNLQVLSLTERIGISSYCGYNYFINVQSVTNTVSKKYEMLPILKELDKNVSNGNISKIYLSHFYRKTMIFNLYLQRKIISTKELNQEYQNLLGWMKEREYPSKWFHKKSESLSIELVMNTFLIFEYLHITKLMFSILKKI